MDPKQGEYVSGEDLYDRVREATEIVLAKASGQADLRTGAEHATRRHYWAASSFLVSALTELQEAADLDGDAESRRKKK